MCLNVLTLFHSRGRGHELANTLEWVLGVLEHRAYLDGTRYYETAECFLFFSARFLHEIRDEALHARIAQLLRERVFERAGCTGDALALAMRVIVGAAVGVRMERDLAALLPLQYEDGGWEPGWIYKYGSSGIKIGNRGLTTALALNAIAALHSSQPQPPQISQMPQPQQKQQRRKQKQKRKQKHEHELEKEKEKEETLPMGESFYRVEISPLPHPRLPVTSVIRGSTSTGISSSPSSPLLQMRRQRRKETPSPSMVVFVKGAFTFLFSWLIST